MAYEYGFYKIDLGFHGYYFPNVSKDMKLINYRSFADFLPHEE